MRKTQGPGSARITGFASSRTVEILGAVALTVVMLAFAGRQGFWYDEAYTAAVVQLPYGEFMDEIRANDQGFWLYYVAAKGWSLLFGTSEVGLRSLSIVAHVTATLVTWRILHARLGLRSALVGTTLILTSAMLVNLAFTARGYALLELGIVSLLALQLRVVERGSRAAWRWFVILLMAVPFINPVGGIAGGLALLVVTVIPAHRNRFRPFFAMLLVGLAWIVAIALTQSQPQTFSFTPASSIHRFIGMGAWTLGGSLLAVFVLVAFAVGAGKLVQILRSDVADEASPKPLAAASASLALIPLVLISAAFWLHPPAYARYFVVPAIGVALVSGFAVHGRNAGRGTTAATGLIVALGVAQLVGILVTQPTGHGDDWREAARVLETTVAPDEGLIAPSPHLLVPIKPNGQYSDEPGYVEIWPEPPWSSLAPSQKYLGRPFGPATDLPADLPGVVWVLEEPSESESNKSVSQALETRGFMRTRTVPFWPSLGEEGMQLARYERETQVTIDDSTTS